MKCYSLTFMVPKKDLEIITETKIKYKFSIIVHVSLTTFWSMFKYDSV